MCVIDSFVCTGADAKNELCFVLAREIIGYPHDSEKNLSVRCIQMFDITSKHFG